jgi:hypothetical protein
MDDVHRDAGESCGGVVDKEARMKSLAVLAVVAGSLLLAPPADAALRCAPSACSDATVVGTVRDAVEAACPCAQATKKGAYKRCAKGVIKTQKQQLGAALSKPCLKAVRQAVANSTCGRSGTVVCNKRNRKDTKTACSVKPTAKCKGSACGAFTSCADACNTAAQACATTTTTTTPVTTTTTTTLAACGDGVVNGTEQCDSPCQQGACGAGQFCSGTCSCVTPQVCACGATDPTQLSFTTTPGAGTCGTVQDASSSTLLNLECGGLYFGGGVSAVSLPAVTPDNGTQINTACCSGTQLTLAPATQADTGSQRTCSSAGCLFGAPLSIPNYLTPALSTCVINEVARDSIGTAECTTGEVNIDLPLTSVVYLTGDLLNGATAQQPDVPGTQPCALCTAVCTGGDRDGLPCTADPECASGGGTCNSGSVTCLGGPNHGNACTPTTSANLGSRCQGGDNSGNPCTQDADCPGVGAVCSFPYPTSHDCPSGGSVIGNLPIPFALTTGTASKTAADLNGAEASDRTDRVFCGFCRDANGGATNGFGICAGGSNAGNVCDLPTDCPEGTCGGEVPCTSNAGCVEPRESCAQFGNGAFSLETGGTGALAATISETGTPAGSLVDHAPHAATLVSVFCIPPTYSPIDAAASLPGPGAVALVGEAQLLP